MYLYRHVVQLCIPQNVLSIHIVTGLSLNIVTGLFIYK